ncbi:MAG: beta-ketoacyl-ACP reductase [Pseudomonadota bacterium]|nr:MAG: beta-ketoacyl-ACP reductase [Pseudomonadota bacterium]
MKAPPAKLSGRVAIVTGAARGIGQAIAEKLAGEGARVIANDIDGGPLAVNADRQQKMGLEITAIAGDITAGSTARSLVEGTLEHYGDLHIIVNNAGYIWNSAALKHSDEQWQAMLDVHATGPFRLLREAGHYFRAEARDHQPESLRKVVNISSISGLYGAATQLAYSTAKAAVLGMTKTLAREWGRYHVTVNCVALGYIDTRLIEPFENQPREVTIKGRDHPVGLTAPQRDTVQQMTALGRLGQPQDAANAVYLLCIPESDFITGEVVVASGGLMM